MNGICEAAGMFPVTSNRQRRGGSFTLRPSTEGQTRPAFLRIVPHRQGTLSSVPSPNPTAERVSTPEAQHIRFNNLNNVPCSAFDSGSSVSSVILAASRIADSVILRPRPVK